MTVYSEDDARNGKLKRDQFLHSNKVPVSEFGHYVESLHAIANKEFKEQFFVSFVKGGVCVVDHTLSPLPLETAQWRGSAHSDDRTAS